MVNIQGALGYKYVILLHMVNWNVIDIQHLKNNTAGEIFTAHWYFTVKLQPLC